MHAFLKVGRIRLKYTADIRKLINAQRSLEAILLSLRPSAEIVGVAPWDESGGGGEKGAIENRYALGRNPINGGGGGGLDARETFPDVAFARGERRTPRSTQYSISKFLRDG